MITSNIENLIKSFEKTPENIQLMRLDILITKLT
jgi:hypothetical protein